jgi:maltose O-acetyltransferase
MVNSREWDRMMEGKLYSPEKLGDPSFHKIKKAQKRFNECEYWKDSKELEKLKKHFMRAPDDMVLIPPVYFDHGNRVSFGRQFYANAGLTILDENRVVFGDRVFLGPHVSIFTAGHPIDSGVRARNVEFSKPVSIGSDVWIGGNVVINPGITIGDDVVIGSGSVVTRDIPDHVVAAGNPCRVLRQITEEDRRIWEKEYRDYLGMKQNPSGGFFSTVPEAASEQRDHAVCPEEEAQSSEKERAELQDAELPQKYIRDCDKQENSNNDGRNLNTENPVNYILENENPVNRISENENLVNYTPENENADNCTLDNGNSDIEGQTKKHKKKKPEEMTDHELLAALLKSQKSDTRFQKAAAVGTFLLAAVFAIAFAILIPQVTLTLQNADKALDQVQVLAGQAQDSLDNVNGLVDSAQHSLSGIDQVVSDNTETITEVTQRLGKIDFDKLDQSIDDLAEVVKTLSEVTSLFR